MPVIYRLSLNFFPERLSLERFLPIALLAFILIAACNTTLVYADDSKQIKLDSKVINGLESGQYMILLRHALAPGFGDPAYFDVNDCSTQRNLSEQGRQQAQRIGKLLKANGIQQAAVYSSQWCRCLETADLLDFGEVTELPIINSFFQRMEKKSQQTQQLRDWLLKNKEPQEQTLQNKKSTSATILVTHQVNITALSNVYPSSGELIIIEIDASGKVSVAARLET